MSNRKMSKTDFETLARFRYQLRRFLRFSEEVTHRNGVTPLQYLLMLQIKGFPGREWATVADSPSACRPNIMASYRWYPGARRPVGCNAPRVETTSDVWTFI